MKEKSGKKENFFKYTLRYEMDYFLYIDMVKKMRIVLFKKKMQFQCDKIFSVSQHTKDVIIRLNGFPGENISVLNNCLDPFLEKPIAKEKEAYVRKVALSIKSEISQKAYDALMSWVVY